MSDRSRPRRQSVQERTLATRAKIVEGAIAVLARSGVAGLTHREVARAAGVSLAATTYHFSSKSEILRETSKSLLEGYLAAFRRLETRGRMVPDREIRSLDQLVVRVVRTALDRERMRSLAWCELVLHGGRSAEGRALANDWFLQLEAIWSAIAGRMDPAPDGRAASTGIDLAVGLTVLLHPLDLPGEDVRAILTGEAALETLLLRRHPELASHPADPAAGPAAGPAMAGEPDGRNAGIRQHIVEAAIGVVADEGVAGVSFRSVAERLGMVRSGPNYYFRSMDDLLAAAHSALFGRARARYREGLKAAAQPGRDAAPLADLAATIFLREALEFHRENIGYYSVWMSAVHDPRLRLAVAGAVLSLDRAWRRRLETIGPPLRDPAISGPDRSLDRIPGVALRLQAIFIGMLIRALATDTDVMKLSRAPAAFADVLAGDRENAPE